MAEWLTPLIGYLASFLLAVSLLVGNAIRFRWISISGCVTFVIYGVLIHTLPIVLTNLVLLAINIFQLVALYRNREDFDFLEIRRSDKPVARFLQYHQRDLQSYFPGFHFSNDKGRICFVVLRDFALSNLFVARLDEVGNAYVEINYTIPRYRDYKVGKFIFETGKSYLLSRGVRRIIYDCTFNRKHERFIRKMGFRKVEMNGRAGYARDVE